MTSTRRTELSFVLGAGLLMACEGAGTGSISPLSNDASSSSTTPSSATDGGGSSTSPGAPDGALLDSGAAGGGKDASHPSPPSPGAPDAGSPPPAPPVSDAGGAGNAGGADAATGPTETVHFIGRFDTTNPASPAFAWSGSQMIAQFTGTGLSVTLNDQGLNFFEVVIDNGTPTVLSTDGTTSSYSLATNLSPGVHTVRLEKRTEAYIGVVSFGGFSPVGGAMVPSAPPFSRSIEMIGDSITAGYGDLGKDPCADVDTGDKIEYVNESAYDSYGGITARALGAAYTDIAYSGIGVYRDGSGNTADQMPVLFLRTLPDDPNSKWGFSFAPDVVVINLGTNDFTPTNPGQPYETAVASFITEVRGHYPNAFIVCTMLDIPEAAAYMQTAVTAANAGGDARVSFVDLGFEDSADGSGCNGHPSLASHQKMAAKLTAGIRAVTGW